MERAECISDVADTVEEPTAVRISVQSELSELCMLVCQSVFITIFCDDVLISLGNAVNCMLLFLFQVCMYISALKVMDGFR